MRSKGQRPQDHKLKEQPQDLNPKFGSIVYGLNHPPLLHRNTYISSAAGASGPYTVIPPLADPSPQGDRIKKKLTLQPFDEKDADYGIYIRKADQDS